MLHNGQLMNQVYIQYQMPNWEFNEIGDLGGADFMNRLYIGWAEVIL